MPGMNCHRPLARGPGVRVGLEGAFHHRQQREFQRHAARFDLLDDVVQVQAGAAEYTFEVLRIVGVEGELLVDARRVDVFELEARADAVEDVRILFRRQPGQGMGVVAGQRLGAEWPRPRWLRCRSRTGRRWRRAGRHSDNGRAARSGGRAGRRGGRGRLAGAARGLRAQGATAGFVWAASRIRSRGLAIDGAAAHPATTSVSTTNGAKVRRPVNPTVNSHPQGDNGYRFRNVTVLG